MQEYWMIRPVLYVDLPGIIYAIDHRARSKQHELANFVCWLEPVENVLPPPPILRKILPLHPAARTWICEDHWHILGFAQVRERPAHTTWELSYLASMANHHLSNEEVLTALLEYTLEMAATHGILRIFARVEDEIPEIELFQRAGFQRYARELTYVYDPDCSLSGFKRAQADPELASLRWWNRHHAWGLYQLYRSVTPQRVLAAELIENSEELAKLYVGSLQSLPSILAKGSENYICDVGVRLGAWMRLCRGYGSVPHRISLFVHPEHAELAEPLVRFGISRLLETGVRRIYCLVREYDSFVTTALRNSGFEQTSAKVLLVRHVALLATRHSTVPLLEQRGAVYGLKGLGTVNSRQKIMR
jgi:N-acetylglutamate synthase-like GNAT family acetyltransferase